ncbi:MarR family transcriptional regulator [Desulfoluna sp.]|uniref:MarR family winged helix-turn-helix transcriptional regulator n=1 Tax=Desulfoluna sp. TaxID=2045199 RepID=UPI002620925A|nr:MarR family transcriptional regulator [Desulfoluna sp.]
MDNEEQIKKIVGSIRRFYRVVQNDGAKESKSFGLTSSQSNVLRTLYHVGPLSSVDLSRNLYVTASNMTGLVDRLEKKALVSRVRKEGDRRVMLIILTPSGLELAQVLPDPLESKLISGLGHMPVDQVKQLNEAMDQILRLINVEGDGSLLSEPGINSLGDVYDPGMEKEMSDSL